jgi:hypothetical protein
MNGANSPPDGKAEACKTYIEQTKLLVTLASAFLFAPAGLVALLKDKDTVHLDKYTMIWFLVVEALFVLSVLTGYVVLGTLAGSQDDGSFNVYRPATMRFSLIQFGLYLGGMGMFIYLAIRIVW